MARSVPAGPGAARGVREIPLTRTVVWLAEPDSTACFYEHGSVRAVFEGLLYNREDLAREIGAAPVATDADLILQAYRRWQEAAVSRIKGLFSLCIWDAAARTLFCARDPLGHYPLFYADTARGLFLSTSVAALAGHPSVSSALNRAVLAGYLTHQWSDCHETCYEAIRRVPPGHALSAGPHGRRIYRHWDPAPPGRRVEWVREDELPKFDMLLEQAVARCLRQGPAGILLSGGLDSVTIAAVATDASRRLGLPAPWALSLAFPDPECNEESAQRQVATALGLPQVLLPIEDAVRPRGFLLSLLDMAREWSQPTWVMWRPAYQRLAEEAKLRGCRVILSGVGGDDWLTVDPIVAADLLGALRLLGLVRLAANLRRSYDFGVPGLLRDVLWTSGARTWLRWVYTRAARATMPGRVEKRRRRMVAASIPSWIAPDRALRGAIVERTLAGIRDPEPRPDGFYTSERRRFLDHPLIAMEVEESFENDRRTGTPEMQPFMDPDLLDFLYRVPPDLLNRGGRNKGLVRQALARRFPDLGFDRQKKVLAGGYHTRIILREGRQAWEAMGGAPALTDLGVLDARVFAAEIEAILSGRKAGEARRIMDVLALEAWVRPRLRKGGG